MKKDIDTKLDTEILVNAFYKKLESDAILGFYFNKVTNKAAFLKKIQLFWENVIFYTGSYDGNPMQIHKDIHGKFPLTPEMFTAWNTVFNQTVDELFKGKNAELIKQRAGNISNVMKYKILGDV
ncbi:MAG: group III truncated hemoglobin [Niabella sp.]